MKYHSEEVKQMQVNPNVKCWGFCPNPECIYKPNINLCPNSLNGKYNVLI